MSPKTQELVRLARKGPLRARDLDAARIPRVYLRRLCDQGLLEQIDRGLYRLASAPLTELSSLAEVGKRAPHAVIGLLSALQLHELTTEAPHRVWLLIDTHARAPKMTSLALEIVRATGDRAKGVEHRRIEGVDVQVTTPSQTVADCFRYRRRVGLDVALAALRDYLARARSRARGKAAKDYSVDSLLTAAKRARVATVMRPYIEALT